ncbi:competence/damage-inducible protein A [Alkalibacterium iburiense]|uniref:Putative competence-damage inducible protein n=1 Tax=Alkalibacterium iburiense TaxID=290589 RepID=A0ABP3HAU0_9LACT
MNAEIISIGTDLLLGQVTNTNAPFLARELTSLGIDVSNQTTIGNTSERLIEAVKQAENRSELIIISGGLGPNKEALANYLGLDLILHEETEDKIITYHKNSNFKMPENNQLQALILADSIPLTNDTGLAVGMLLEHNNHTYVLLPGPADELEPTVNNYLKEELVNRLFEKPVLKSRVLNFFGLTEDQIHSRLESALRDKEEINVIVYSKKSQVAIRLTAMSHKEEDAENSLNQVEERIKGEFSEYFFGYEDKDLSDVIKDLLIEKDLMITAAESLTGGAFLSSLTSGLSAGAILEGGLVTYSNEMKNEVLKVTKKTIDSYGVISPECAIEMAEKSRKLFNADIGVGFTGVAGPSSMEGQIPGTVWIGISYQDKKSFAKHYHFGYKRNKNRELTVLNALDLVRRVVLDLPVETPTNYGEDK